MEYVLTPFITIYHIVSAILSVPAKLFSKAEDKVLEKTDQRQLSKEQQELQQLNGENPSQPLLDENGNPIEGEVALPDTPDALEDKTKRVKRPVKPYRYTIINDLGKKEIGTFDAESENDVRNFLLAQEYKILEIKERSKMDIDLNFGGGMKAGDLSFSLTQLSTYIKSGIPLVDSVRILAKQTNQPNLKKSFNQLVYELLRGESFSNAMISQGNTYPKLLINMVKTAEMTGDLPTILDDMSEYYTSMERTKKQMKSAMTYPVVVLTLAIGVLIFMLTYLVPQFAGMFADNDATLPGLTLAILGISDFLKTNYLIIIACVGVAIGIFIYLYKNIVSFRTTIQITLMRMPVAGKIIIYNEITNFTKTFASLINHGVFITDSMEILSKITNNEIYKKIINTTLISLSKGDSISSAFKGEWAVPVVAYEMLVTGETTGQLGTMMEKVSNHFQNLHKNMIDQMKSLIEQILICILEVVVGIILISIIQPMLSIYGQFQ